MNDGMEVIEKVSLHQKTLQNGLYIHQNWKIFNIKFTRRKNFPQPSTKNRVPIENFSYISSFLIPGENFPTRRARRVYRAPFSCWIGENREASALYHSSCETEFSLDMGRPLRKLHAARRGKTIQLLWWETWVAWCVNMPSSWILWGFFGKCCISLREKYATSTNVMRQICPTKFAENMSVYGSQVHYYYILLTYGSSCIKIIYCWEYGFTLLSGRINKNQLQWKRLSIGIQNSIVNRRWSQAIGGITSNGFGFSS